MTSVPTTQADQPVAERRQIAALNVPLLGGAHVSISVFVGDIQFLVGGNGTGKSALMHHFKMQLGDVAEYMPGSRPSFFDAENFNMTPAARTALVQNLRTWDAMPDSRWRAISGTSRNEKAVHELHASEVDFHLKGSKAMREQGPGSVEVKKFLVTPSPFDRINELVAQANLPVRLEMDKAELRARRGARIFSFAKMSDGERTALIFAAQVSASPAGTVFLVDEPELHLHRSITVPLMKSLIAMRPDCAFIVSTHELGLPGEIAGASAVLVRGCEWNGDAVGWWDLDLITNLDELPEDLRVDVLGSRKRLLFVEGVPHRSLDHPLYSLLFPSASVVPKENCRAVHQAVVGMRNARQHHHAEALGIVDQDGMDAARVASLKDDDVFALPVYSVESLYYDDAVLTAVAEQQVSTFGGSAADLLNGAKTRALQSLSEAQLVNLASHVAERRMRDLLFTNIPDRAALIGNTTDRVAVDIPSPYPEELKRIRDLLTAVDLASIVRRYPVRESGVLAALAGGLMCNNTAGYERAALARIASSEALRKSLRDALGEISTRLRD